MQSSKISYGKSLLIVVTIIIIGFLIEYFSRSKGFNIPSFPINLIILLFFVAYLIFSYFIFRKTEIIAWFTSIPLTISVVTSYTFLALIMGFIKQEPHNHFIDKIGLTHIINSYPFILINLLLLMVLGYTIIKRLTKKVNLRNIAFFLNHAGLFIFISAGSIGTGDMIRLSVPVDIGETSDIAFSRDNKMLKLPFSITLNDFTIEEYAPELLVYNRKTGLPIIPKGSKLPFIEKSKEIEFLDLDFKIIEFYSFAAPKDSFFIDSERFGTVHAALISVSDKKTNKTSWISTSNFMHESSFLFFNEKYVIGIAKPKVKKYQSNISIDESNQNIIIEVNKPYKYSGWKIYQNSYNSQLGRWSQTSIFEVIRDPWLPVVYVGLFMLLIGSCYLIYAGRQMNVK